MLKNISSYKSKTRGGTGQIPSTATNDCDLLPSVVML